MTADEYVPSEEEMYQAYRRNRLLDHHQDVEAAFDRFLARVRRDAAREALDGLIAASNWESDRAPEPYRYRFGKVVSVAAVYRDTHYPEEILSAARRDEEKR